ncbi:hypothetical protein scyTo_0006933 [Scyliorhinus torazame]|uniref:Uncharacterized protein n=1 Tax=Scyliorhinus torazame TaxID=75743 RepID=A0A401NIV6_SCYTO|nr:hypothetical protein [Scyliorhinus torazame]
MTATSKKRQRETASYTSTPAPRPPWMRILGRYLMKTHPFIHLHPPSTWVPTPWKTPYPLLGTSEIQNSLFGTLRQSFWLWANII